jgi:tetratricopeptide (TPR) repeat protein
VSGIMFKLNLFSKERGSISENWHRKSSAFVVFVMSFFILLAGLVPPAHAQSDKDKKEAYNYFVKAREHLNAGEYLKCVEQLEIAYGLFPDATLTENMAICYEKNGDYEAARAKFQAYIASGPSAAAVARARDAIIKLDKLIKQRKPTKKQLLVVTDPVQGYVWIDGRLFGPSPLPVVLEPGVHTIRVDAKGYQEVEKQIDLQTVNTTMHIMLVPVASKDPVQPGVATTIQDPSDKKWQLNKNPWPWVTIASGVFLIGGGIAMDIARSDTQDFLDFSGWPDVDPEADTDDPSLNVSTDGKYADRLLNRSNGRLYIEYGLFAAGAALVAGGITWLYFQKNSNDEEMELENLDSESESKSESDAETESDGTDDASAGPSEKESEPKPKEESPQVRNFYVAPVAVPGGAAVMAGFEF